MSNQKIDEYLGLPIIDSDELVRLTVSNEKFNLNPVKYSFNSMAITVFDGKFISQIDKDKILISQGMTIDKYTPVSLKGSSTIDLPNSFTNLKACIEALNKNIDGKSVYGQLDCISTNLAYFLSFFCVYEGFGPIYDSYISNCDEGIAIIDIRPTNVSTVVEGEITSFDVRSTVHILLLLMSKTFTTDASIRESHIKNYVSHRMRAVNFALRQNDSKFLIDQKSLDNMINIWNSFPKLKKEIFYFIFSIRSKYPELSTALMLLADSSMVTISSITRFLSAEKKTKAHALKEIFREAKMFNDEVKNLKKEMGSMWAYLRVIRPGDVSLAASKFPNLSRASIIYVKTFINKSESFARVVEPNYPTVAGLDNFAKTPLSEDYIDKDSDSSSQLTSDDIAIAKSFGIDIAKWQPPGKMRATLLSDDNNENLLAMLTNVVQKMSSTGTDQTRNIN